MAAPAATATARLFFGIPIEGSLAEALGALAGELARQAGGRAVPSSNLHATLAFLGMVPRARIDVLRSIGDGLAGSRCDVLLDRVGSFRRARVAWIGTSAPPAPLAAVQGALAQRIRDAGWTLDERPFALHVTLVRHCRATLPSTTVPALRWPVDRVVLYESVGAAGGPRYVPWCAWPLAAR